MVRDIALWLCKWQKTRQSRAETRGRVCTCAMVQLWHSEHNLLEPILFYHVDIRDQTQGVRLLYTEPGFCLPRSVCGNRKPDCPSWSLPTLPSVHWPTPLSPQAFSPPVYAASRTGPHTSAPCNLEAFHTHSAAPGLGAA